MTKENAIKKLERAGYTVERRESGLGHDFVASKPDTTVKVVFMTHNFLAAGFVCGVSIEHGERPESFGCFSTIHRGLRYAAMFERDGK